MGLATEKAAYIRKHGDPVTIIRSSGNIATTARIIAVKRKTDFFSVNYLREGMFTADSGVCGGDLIRNEATGEQFFVMAVQNKTVGGSLTSINTELYKVNCQSASCSRPRDITDGKLNKIGIAWDTVATVQANAQHVRGGEKYKVGMLLPSTEILLTIQATVDVKIDHRFILDDGKAYKVDDINTMVSPGLLVIQLSTDMRK